MKQHDPLRLWKIGGAFVVAAAGLGGVGYMLAEAGREEKPSAPQIAEPAKLAPRPAHVWGVASEIGADGKQKSTNNMWGLMMRATNEADSSQNKMDREYSKDMSEIQCYDFWEARRNYNSFLNGTDAVQRFKALYFLPQAHIKHITGKDRHNIKQLSSFDKELYEPARKAAEEELRRKIQENPHDLIGNQQRFSELYMTESIDGDQLLDSQRQSALPALEQAYKVIGANEKIYGVDTTEGAAQYNAVTLMVGLMVSSSLDDAAKSRLTSALTPAFSDKLKAIYSMHMEHDINNQAQFRRDQGAPCP